jgi:Na+:H+ antiporter, NhaA family
MNDLSPAPVPPPKARFSALVPLQVIFKLTQQGGMLLLLALVAALVARNSGLGDLYLRLWSMSVPIPGAGATTLLILNDGLMAVFFLTVGAEIKHQVTVGELSGGIGAALVPALAALGGMLVPALIYLVVAPSARNGFGVPMATDIAFALAAMNLLGNRVPRFLRAVLLGLAIIDDLGAIVVIAMFYGGHIDAAALVAAVVIIAVLVVLNRRGVTSLWPYLLLGLPLWVALHDGGVHPTLAGVFVAFAIPARVLDGQHPPLELITARLDKWVNWLIVPMFAFANGGVNLSGMTPGSLLEPISLGIILGLFVGKQLGVFATVMTCARLGLVKLPSAVGAVHVWGMAILAGIGFTMSLFVSALAFHDDHSQDAARAGILVGSLLSMLVGVAVLRLAPRVVVEEPG